MAPTRVEGRVEHPIPRRELDLVLAAQAGSQTARAELVEAFIMPIARVARLYRGARGISREELMQEGVVGLLRALARYDPSFGTPFWAYATWWVRQAMQQVVAELTRPVVLSDRAMRQLARVRSAECERLQSHRKGDVPRDGADGLVRVPGGLFAESDGRRARAIRARGGSSSRRTTCSTTN